MSIYPDEKPKEEPQKIHFGLTEEINEDQKKLLKQLVEVMGVTELAARTDRLEQTMDSVVLRLDEVIKSNNAIVTAMQGNNQTPSTTIGSATQPPQINQMDKIEAIGKLIQSLDPIIERYFRPQQVQSSIIDPEYINEKVRNSIMGNFEVGEALIGQLKSKITSKAIGQVVKDIVTHEPA